MCTIIFSTYCLPEKNLHDNEKEDGDNFDDFSFLLGQSDNL
jgi:hypothetical protein